MVNEILHHVKKKRDKYGLFAIKIDLHKAFDKVDWSVLSNILNQFGFSARVISLFNQCFAVESFEILLNDSVVGIVKLEREIRQRDPLSLLFFIILTELLSSMLYRFEKEGKIQGIKISRTSLLIAHPKKFKAIEFFWQETTQKTTS